MFEPLTLLLIIGGILGLGLAITIFSKIMKVLSIIITIVLIFSALLGYFVFKDVEDFKTNWSDSKKLIILQDDEGYLAVISGRLSGEEETLEIIPKLDYAKIANALENENYAELQKNYFKIITVHTNALSSVKTVMFEDFSLSKEKALGIIRNSETIPGIDATAEEVQAYLLQNLFLTAMGDDPLFFIKQLRAGTVAIQPETLSIKVITIAPEMFIKNMIQTKIGDGK